MKRFSIKFKIMMFYTVCTTLIVAIMLLFMVHVSGLVVDMGIKDNLVLMVEEDVDDIDFDIINDDEIAGAYEDGDVVFYTEDGLIGSLSVDESYVTSKNGVRILVFGPNDRLLLGDSFDYRLEDVDIKDGEITHASFGQTDYYVYSRLVTLIDKNIPVEFMIVGVVQDTAGSFSGATGSLLKLNLIILPFAIALAALLGYFVTRALFKPIGEITKTAEKISKGDDLSQRIDLGPGGDELHKLADTYNTMLSRLQTSFESEKAFTSDSSHELRTPTAIISAQCEYALSEPRTKEEYVESLEVINRQSQRMSVLISQLLSFTRLEQGTQKLVMEKFNLSSLVNELCNDMEAAQTTDIRIKYDIEPEVFINADMTLIYRMVSNLLSNAYKYGKPGGYVKVSVKNGVDSRKGGCAAAVLIVEDNGIGIAKEELELIFQRFYKGDKSRTSDPEGQTSYGLGLAFVQKIAQLHEGRVTVQSKLDKGSRFIVILPQ